MDRIYNDLCIVAFSSKQSVNNEVIYQQINSSMCHVIMCDIFIIGKTYNLTRQARKISTRQYSNYMGYIITNICSTYVDCWVDVISEKFKHYTFDYNACLVIKLVRQGTEFPRILSRKQAELKNPDAVHLSLDIIRGKLLSAANIWPKLYKVRQNLESLQI